MKAAGAALTSDSGEFALAMAGNLHVGMAAVFHVKDWVILKPCELKSGRTYLRDPSAEPIEFLVLAPGDPRLKSAKANVSIIGCLLEEEASQFAPKPKPAGGPRSSLPHGWHPVFAGQVDKEYAGADLKPDRRATHYYLVATAYRLPVSQSPSELPSKKPTDAADAARR